MPFALRISTIALTESQPWVRDVRCALGFDVWIAANDVSRSYGVG